MTAIPPRTKKCSGPCGRELDEGEFYTNRRKCRRCYIDQVRQYAARTRGDDPELDVTDALAEAEAMTSTFEEFATRVPFPEDVTVLATATPPTSRWPNLDAFDVEQAAQPEVRQRTVVVEEVVTQVEEHRLKQDNARLRSMLKDLTAKLSDAEMLADFAAAARDVHVDPIVPRERASVIDGKREAIAMAMASDWHIEEEVLPEQVAGRNRYNLAISRRRMERFFEAVLWAVEFNRQEFLIRDLLLWLGGDLITNYLHPDNVETNLMSPPEALAYAYESICAGIRFLLARGNFERVVLPCNDGNHGRMTDKMRSAARTQSSLEILLYRMLAQAFADEPRVQFIIAGGEHLYYEVYGRTIRFAHGDSIRYGGGIGGILIPVYRALSRWETMRHADLTCLGHFHTRTVLPDLMVNSSLIGYSPFSLTIGARFESPSQNFSILEKERFRSVDLPLWVSEREDDELFAAA